MRSFLSYLISSVPIRFAAIFLVPLLIIDLFLIGGYLAFGLLSGAVGASVPYVFDIRPDWGVGEQFNYLKWSVCVMALALAWWNMRRPLLLSLATMFLVILLDDMLQLHETFGGRLAEHLGLGGAFRVGPQDWGEILVWLSLGAVILGALTVGFLRTPRKDWGIGLLILVNLAVLVGCAVFGDIAGSMAGYTFTGGARETILFLIGAFENGGEMIFASTACAIGIAVWYGTTVPSVASVGGGR